MEPFIFIIPIAIIVFFILNYLLKSKIQKHNKRLLFSISGSILLAPLMYIIFIFSIFYFASIEGSRKFDQEIWINATQEENIKYQMADNLISSGILIGKDSLNVKKIVGEPYYRNSAENNWSYYLGFGGGIGFVEHELIIVFSGNRVASVEHIRIKD